ncbi:GGDEF domain-containing protein [Couchioplanes caeruleus]|uniref:GGDEF domain-containing protein n=1 Tax=Couchioplanes caeruleus TaxID=56438 RepID=UPI0020BE7B84|nr:GGDEF domain-containing protein [Couchioplanes caeruleus]UQU68215.1 GGDEF domain-containing protein [Couchioplanes caeruleus]
MLLREDRPGYELRDLHGASRAVAYLTLAAAPYTLITGLLTPNLTRLVAAAVIVVSIGMGVTGITCWRRPDALPRAFWFAAPALATGLVSALNLGTADASTGSQLFYLWPVLYAANFLGRHLIHLNLALVFGGHAAVVLTLLGVSRGLADWFAMLLAMTMTAIVVSSLRARADRLRAVLQEQANADALTGLANRRFFAESLAHAGTWAADTGGSLALVTVDLDHFKAINDTYGHTEGDRALQTVAAALRHAVGDTGVAARLGGDEFVMLLRTDRPSAIGVAETVREMVSAATDLPGGPPRLSIGVAVLPGDAATVDELVTASDAALYEAKTSGRGRTATAPERHNVDRVRPGQPAELTSPSISRRSRG